MSRTSLADASNAPPSADAIAQVFALGRPVASLVPVAGGQSHRMWQLSTTTGRYAVKELNRDFGNPAYLAWYDRAFRIEMAALQAGLLMPQPVPVPGTERCWAELPDGGNRPTTVRAHEWVEGKAPSIRDKEIAVHAGAVGALLARIHALRLATDTMPVDIFTVYGEEHWRDLNGRVSSAGLPWADRFVGVLSHVSALEALVVAARDEAGLVLLTHRDVDVKNVLVTADGGLLLLDWDSAGPGNPRHEVVTAALDWAGVHDGEPDASVARALVTGYRSAGGDLSDPSLTDLAGFFKTYLDWLECNVRRCLGERMRSPAHQRLAEQEVLTALQTFPRFAKTYQDWVALMR